MEQHIALIHMHLRDDDLDLGALLKDFLLLDAEDLHLLGQWSNGVIIVRQHFLILALLIFLLLYLIFLGVQVLKWNNSSQAALDGQRNVTLMDSLDFRLDFLSDFWREIVNNISHLIMEIRGVIHDLRSSTVQKLNFFELCDYSLQLVIPGVPLLVQFLK